MTRSVVTVRVGATVTHIHDPTEAARWIDLLVAAAVGSSPFEARYQMTESACHATPSTRATSVMRDTRSRDKRIDVVEATLHVQDATGASHLQQLEVNPLGYGIDASARQAVRRLRRQRNKALHGKAHAGEREWANVSSKVAAIESRLRGGDGGDDKTVCTFGDCKSATDGQCNQTTPTCSDFQGSMAGSAKPLFIRNPGCTTFDVKKASGREAEIGSNRDYNYHDTKRLKARKDNAGNHHDCSKHDTKRMGRNADAGKSRDGIHHDAPGNGVDSHGDTGPMYKAYLTVGKGKGAFPSCPSCRQRSPDPTAVFCGVCATRLSKPRRDRDAGHGQGYFGR